MTPIKIGDVFLARKVLVRNSNFNQAVWYEDMEIPAGRYPVYATEVSDHSGEVIHNSPYVQFSGSVVEDYFPPTMFGYPIGLYDRKKNKGSATHFRLPLYTHTIADSIFYAEGRINWLDTHLTVTLASRYVPIRLTIWNVNEPTDYLSIVQQPR